MNRMATGKGVRMRAADSPPDEQNVTLRGCVQPVVQVLLQPKQVLPSAAHATAQQALRSVGTGVW
jgi:hypothetical protein